MVRKCTLVCHCLRAVSLEHLFGTSLVAREIPTLDHIISFLRTHPKICAKIQSLTLWGDVSPDADQQLLAYIDDTTVLSLMQLVPNVQYLSIRNIRCAPPQLPQQQTVRSQQDGSEPFHLQRLVFDPGYYGLPHDVSIAGLFRILPLFTIDVLDLNFRRCECDTVPFDISALHHSLKIKDLRLSHWDKVENDSMGKLLKLFAESLEQGFLQHLSTGCRTVSEVSAIGEFLACTGEGLRSLQVERYPLLEPSHRKDWKDPLDSTSVFRATLGRILMSIHIGSWQNLNLASCTKLESIMVQIFFRSSPSEKHPTDVPALSLAGAGMLSQVSGTLRTVEIYVHDLPRVTTLNNRRVLRLQEFDKVLTPDRSPRLEKVKVHIRSALQLQQKREYRWQQIVVGTQKVLPNIHSRGLLEVMVL